MTSQELDDILKKRYNYSVDEWLEIFEEVQQSYLDREICISGSLGLFLHGFNIESIRDLDICYLWDSNELPDIQQIVTPVLFKSRVLVDIIQEKELKIINISYKNKIYPVKSAEQILDKKFYLGKTLSLKTDDVSLKKSKKHLDFFSKYQINNG